MKFKFLPENFSRSENAPPFETRKIRLFEVQCIRNFELTFRSRQNSVFYFSAETGGFECRGKPSGLTFHSDQGMQYSAYAFRMYLRECGVIQSFSNPGTPHDNAVAEAFFSIMKREEISHNYYHTEEELDKTVTDFIDFYNSMRPHRKLHNLSPDQFEKSFSLRGQMEQSNGSVDR